MIPESVAASSTHDVMDVVLHDEIQRRAYELYERQADDVDHQNPVIELQSELGRVAYAAAQVQMCNQNCADSRGARAARVYLRALCTVIARS